MYPHLSKLVVKIHWVLPAEHSDFVFWISVIKENVIFWYFYNGQCNLWVVLLTLEAVSLVLLFVVVCLFVFVFVCCLFILYTGIWWKIIYWTGWVNINKIKHPIIQEVIIFLKTGLVFKDGTFCWYLVGKTELKWTLLISLICCMGALTWKWQGCADKTPSSFVDRLKWNKDKWCLSVKKKIT